MLAGLNPSEIRDMVPVIRAIRDRGVTIVMIEHVMQAVMSLAEHVFVLAEGRIIAEGSPAAIASDPRVVEAYLGHGAAGRLRPRERAAWLSPLLEVSGLHAGYGATEVLRGVDLAVRRGRDRRGARLERRRQVDAQPGDLRRAAAVARLDPLRPAQPSSARQPSTIVARGLIHVPEGRRIFPNMTVRENLDLGGYRRGRARRAREPRPRVRDLPAPRRAAVASAPARCPAASSRCWRSAAA